MSEIADRYARLSTAFDATLRGVAPDGWDVPTPCPAWTARQLVEHVANNTGVFLKLIGEPPPELPPAAEDPAETWRVADVVAKEALADPSRADQEFKGYFGPTTLAKAMDQFMSFDLVVHRWDLARATGQDERIPDDEVVRIFDTARGFRPALRQNGVCAEPLDPPPGADEQTKLLAFLGRRA